MTATLHVDLIAGARPNFMKIASVHRALSARRGFAIRIVHTGQHYDEKMSGLFFEQLGLPPPDVNLEVGSATHAVQTAEILRKYEALLSARRPDIVVVVGDVNSTVACALVAKKLAGVVVAHVEAGLRSFDRTMPEEINRVVTDSISDLLFTSERGADRNLLGEGVPEDRIRFVGNVMIDTLRAHLDRARATGTVAGLGLPSRGYGLVTLHRPSNVDDDAVLVPLMDAIADISRRLPLVFPVHPRTRGAVERWLGRVGASDPPRPALRLTEPLGYLEFLHLMSEAKLVLTDSGGIQEETTYLGVPCITLRENTERPSTVEIGTNVLVGRDVARLRAEALGVLEGRRRAGRIPEGWDGRAGERIADALEGWDRSAR